MHSSHLPLRTWFLAAHIVTSHSNGMSALQLQAQFGLGSYKTAWLLLQKLWRARANPDRNPLKDLVEVDETEMLLRSRHDPADRPKGGRSPVGKMFIVGAVELSDDAIAGQRRQHDCGPPDELVRSVAVGDQGLKISTVGGAKEKAEASRLMPRTWQTKPPLGILCQVANTNHGARPMIRSQQSGTIRGGLDQIYCAECRRIGQPRAGIHGVVCLDPEETTPQTDRIAKTRRDWE
jgi:hypothetical protein